MKKIALIALSFALICCLMTGCRFNNGTNTESSTTGSTGSTHEDGAVGQIIDDMTGRENADPSRYMPRRNIPNGAG